MATTTLQDLGYNDILETYRREQNMESFSVGRVILEHKDRYIVKTNCKELDTELIGNLRFTAENRYDLPAVGDWVAISEYDEDKALIHAIYPRHSIIERQAIGKYAHPQIIATNVDCGLIVQSVNRDFNINRLERYLTICNASKVESVIVLSKIDLIDELTLKTLLNDIKKRIKNVPIIAISNPSKIGLDKIKVLINSGKTYCLLGSSGVGKSTLLNLLIGEEHMQTNVISKHTDRGKHITTHRELIVLEYGGIIIDNPGMREIGITKVSEGLDMSFDIITELSQHCKFKNCTHTSEKGCAILKALENGVLDSNTYTNFQKIEKESAFFESSIQEKKKKDKRLGKMIKSIQKQRKQNKY